MFESHLVNDEDLVVLLGDLLPTVRDVAAAVLRVHLNTVKCKDLSVKYKITDFSNVKKGTFNSPSDLEVRSIFGLFTTRRPLEN